ncbi:signal recognition particle-docking protein FtsY [Candidatus Dependentiae bacterium]|nr:signal recognition particle-docking protein FtsY [Candidatus Dependentiae bacterium]
MFGFIKEKLTKIYSQFSSKTAALFSRNTINQQFLDELAQLLITADTGVETTNTIIKNLTQQIQDKKIASPQEVKKELERQLISRLKAYPCKEKKPTVLLLVGINGSGKTTFAGKLAKQLTKNATVLLVAGDTFRAAATQQLLEWGKKIGVDVFIGKEQQDPASVIFDACKKFKTERYDHLIIDTAGRLQTKTNLMKELEKMRRIIDKQLPDKTIHTWLTVDSMLGQNSFEQAKIFNEATTLTGLVLTKLDGTGKGGIVFSITNELHLPIIYVTFGEDLGAIKPFDANEYIGDLL